MGRRLIVAAVLVATLVLWLPGASADRATARALAREGRELAERGHIELALERYEEAITSDPSYLPSYELALPIWFRLGELVAAQTRLEALTLACDDCVFAWYALGAIYRKQGRFDLAILAYEAYLAKRPKDADAHFGMAMAMVAAGDERRVAALRRYLELEDRPQRRAFRRRALRLLEELGAEPLRRRAPETRESDASLARVQALLAAGRLASAERLLGRSQIAGRAGMKVRAAIAAGRGQWFQRAGYLGLAWLFAPSR